MAVLHVALVMEGALRHSRYPGCGSSEAAGGVAAVLGTAAPRAAPAGRGGRPSTRGQGRDGGSRHRQEQEDL